MVFKRNTQSDEFISETPGGGQLQITRWTEKRVSITVLAATDRATIPVGSELIELSATENMYINFGDDSVTASSTIADDGSRLFLAGVQVVPVPLDSSNVPFTHVAAIRDSTDGILQIEKVE